jgi:hypothetical protein
MKPCSLDFGRATPAPTGNAPGGRRPSPRRGKESLSVPGVPCGGRTGAENERPAKLIVTLHNKL